MIHHLVILKIKKDHQEALRAHWQAAIKGIQQDTTKVIKDGIKELEEAIKLDDSEPKIVAGYAFSLGVLGFERGEKEYMDKAKAAADRAMKVADEQPAAVAAKMLTLRAENKPE